MDNQVQCPVCTLFLHVGMNLEQHLETHPKEQVIKALVAFTIQNNSPINQTTNEFPYSIDRPTRSNTQVTYLHPQQQNLVLVKSTDSTQYYQRNHTDLPHKHDSIQYLPLAPLSPGSCKNDRENMHILSGQQYPFIETHMSPHSLTETRPDYENLEMEPQDMCVNYIISSPRSNFGDEIENSNQQRNNYDESETLVDVENIDDTQLPSEEHLNNYDTCLREFGADNFENSQNCYEKPIAAKYYEKDNGDFLLQESPKAFVEYTEKDDGEFLVTEKVVRTPVGVVRFNEDEEELLNLKVEINDTEKVGEKYHDNKKMLIRNENFSNNSSFFGSNKKSTYGLKVLSNVKVTPDMLSTGMKEIIFSVQTNSRLENKECDLLEGSTKSTENDFITNLSKNIKSEKEELSRMTTSVIRAHSSDVIERDVKTETIVNNAILETELDESTDDEMQKPSTASVIKMARAGNSATFSRSNKKPFFNRTPKKLVVKFKKPFVPTVDTGEISTAEHLEEEEQCKDENDDNRIQLESRLDTEKVAQECIFKSSSSHGIKDKIRKEKMYKSKTALNESEHIVEATTKLKHHKKKNYLLGHDNKSYTSPKSPKCSKTSNENLKQKNENDTPQVNSLKCSSEILTPEEPIVEPMSNILDNKYEYREENLENLESKPILVENLNPNEEGCIIITDKQEINVELEISKVPAEDTKAQLQNQNNFFASSTENQNWNQFTGQENSNDDLRKENVDNIQKEENEYIKTESWTSHLTSALETVQSHGEEYQPQSIEPPFIIKEATFTTETVTKSMIPSRTTDLVEAGPSRLDYGFSSFLNNYNEPESENFLCATERSRFSVMEFMEEGLTWRHPFSPQYVQFDNDRNSYMDLDQYKVNSNYNRAPSTESLNIRTDEKMPAKGEISEQESNGEIESVPWSQQLYPYQNDSTHKYPSTYDSVTKEGWNLNNETNDLQNPSSLQNISKFYAICTASIDQETKPFESPISKIQKVKIENIVKRKRKIRCYRCLECPIEFTSLKAKKMHVNAFHQASIFKSLVGTNFSATPELTSSVYFKKKIDDESKFDLKRSLTKEKFSLKLNGVETKQSRTMMDFNELKKELSEKGAIVPAESPKVKKRRTYVCSKCKEEFNSIKLFDKHLSVHPAECQQCGRLFRHWTNLAVHLKRHLGIKNYACRCGKRFVLRQKLIEHMRIHTGSAPIPCADCPLKFRRYSNLIQHRNRHHLNIKPEQKDYVCHCGEVYHTKAKFAWHKEIHDKKPKGCPYCRERFIHQNSLTRHIRLSHSEKYSFYKSQAMECPICNKLYLKTSMKLHINIHKIKTEFKCNICNKAFSTKWNLKQHRWIHACRSTKPFKCKICTSAFIRETDYITHMNIHKSIKPFTCDYCGCQFSRKYNWLRHTREHEAPKKHKCDICSKSFHRAYYLTEHLRVHSGERPFSCNICGKTSATKTNHNKHIKIHHARDPLTAEG